MNWRKYGSYKKKVQVHCKYCDSWINEEKTKFVNIEEGMQGEDILTFVCPDCGQTSTSKRYG